MMNIRVAEMVVDELVLLIGNGQLSVVTDYHRDVNSYLSDIYDNADDELIGRVKHYKSDTRATLAARVVEVIVHWEYLK